MECCNIQYEGRDYKKLSKSQQARACLEISNVFNNISGINAQYSLMMRNPLQIFKKYQILN